MIIQYNIQIKEIVTMVHLYNGAITQCFSRRPNNFTIQITTKKKQMYQICYISWQRMKKYGNLGVNNKGSEELRGLATWDGKILPL